MSSRVHTNLLVWGSSLRLAYLLMHTRRDADRTRRERRLAVGDPLLRTWLPPVVADMEADERRRAAATSLDLLADGPQHLVERDLLIPALVGRLDELGGLVPGAEVVVEHEEAVEEGHRRWSGVTLVGVVAQLRDKGLDPEAGVTNGQLVGGLGQLDEDEPWEVAAVPVQSMSTRLSGRC